MLPIVLTCVQHSADHARENHEEHGQKFEITAQDAASFHMGQALGRQTALHYHLKQDECLCE